MSKMSDMTEYHASAYRLPSGFEHCSKLKPVAEAATALDRVKAVVDVLCSPGGCPWDGKQTNKSLLKNLLEETYEYVDAVETHDRDNMREELGDVLLQSVFQARVCESDTEDLRLMLSEMMYILKRRTNPNQAATIPLNGRRPMPTPMKSSPSCARPALTASISSPHCAIACVMSKKKSP